ncbi:hypothetical protein [Streptomyces sp. NPDC046385]|uniref:hypothetical protein n=1 Tax=Streptomyces sp. NPDC046385 TaxID=3154918 RepID=UPI0033FFFA91
MNAVLAPATFATGARDIINSLETRFLHDEDLANDLDEVLGAPSGPVNMPAVRRRGPLVFRRLRSPEPTRGEVAELGRAVTRLERMLDRLITIAKRREWMPPYPNVAEAIVRAEAAREQHRTPVGDYTTDRAHLRHLAMAAADLLAPLVVINEEGER